MRKNVVLDRVLLLELIRSGKNSALERLLKSYKSIILPEGRGAHHYVAPMIGKRAMVPIREIEGVFDATNETQVCAFENYLNATTAWAKYQTHTKPGGDSMHHTLALLLLARWFDADICCYWDRRNLFADCFDEISVENKRKQLRFGFTAIETAPTSFPEGPRWHSLAPRGQNRTRYFPEDEGDTRLNVPFSYRIISRDPNAIINKSWRQLLADSLGPAATKAIIIIGGLSVAGYALYANFQSALAIVAKFTEFAERWFPGAFR